MTPRSCSSTDSRPEAEFEGRQVGAIERIESGGSASPRRGLVWIV